MSFLCCNWCLNIFGSSEENKSDKKPYEAQSLTEDLDEQQLIQQQSKDKQSKLPSQYFHQQEELQDLSKQLNVQMNLMQNQPHGKQDQKSQSNSKAQSQHHDSQSEKDQNQNLLDQVPTQQKLTPDYTKFTINLDPYDKYYKLLHQKTDNLQKFFTLEGKPIEFGETKSKLRINKIQNNKFEVRFELPCPYSFYSMLMKDTNILGKKYLTQFQKHQILQSFKPNFTKNLTKMKRFNMLEPRQFTYLKYSNGSFKQNWQICISENDQDLLAQKDSQHKRCDIFSVSNFKEINDKLYVRQYVEIDLKSSSTNISIWGKIMHEVKQYFQKLYTHVENYYQKELL